MSTWLHLFLIENVSYIIQFPGCDSVIKYVLVLVWIENKLVMVWDSCCLVSKSRPILCDPVDCITPGFPVLHYLLEFAHILVHLSRWCYLISSSFAALFSFCLKPFPASGSLPISWLFPSGGWSIGASALVSVLPKNIQGWFPLGLTDLISLLSRELLSLLQHHSLKASILWHSVFFIV